MTYLYTFLGITAWVATIAFSSNALISYENGKQAESAKSLINKTAQQITVTKAVTPTTTQVTTETQQVAQEVQPIPEVVSQPTTPKVVAPVTTKPAVRTYRDEEGGDDN